MKRYVSPDARTEEMYPKWRVFGQDIDALGAISPEYCFFENAVTRLEAMRSMGDQWGVVEQKDSKDAQWRIIFYVRLQEKAESLEKERLAMRAAMGAKR